MGIYAFRPGPSYRAATPTEQMSAALDMPLSLTSTLGESFKGGILDSLGLGTAIREGSLPDEAPTTPTVTTTGPDGETITLPDTPQMRRRATVQGFELQRETQEQLDARRRDVGAMDEAQYKSSAYFRDGVKYDAGMTEDRAAALAEAYDAKRVREYFATKRPITSFLGNLAGQAVDPINYIPIAGPAVKAANIARFGRLAGTAATGAIDAAANTALASGVTYDIRKSMGDEITWQSTISDIAMSALIGGAFGTIGGAIEGRKLTKLDAARKLADERLSTLRNVQDARIALNDAIGGLARGEDVSLGGNAGEAVQRLSENLLPPERVASFAGDIPIRHGFDGDSIPDFVKDFSGSRYDGNSFGNRGVYLDNHGQWTTKGEFARFQPKHVAAGQVSFRNALVVSPDTMLDIQKNIPKPNRPEIGDNANLYFGEDFVKFAEENGYDGIVVQGFTDKMKTYDGEVAAVQKYGAHESVMQDQIFAFDPAAVKLDDRIYKLGDSDVPSIGGKVKTAAHAKRVPASVDLSSAKPEPLPTGKVEAESRVGTPDTIKAMSEQYRVNPDDGSFIEQADIEQVRKEGRITPEDDMLMNEAQKAYDDGVAFGEALKAAASCMI